MKYLCVEEFEIAFELMAIETETGRTRDECLKSMELDYGVPLCCIVQPGG